MLKVAKNRHNSEKKLQKLSLSKKLTSKKNISKKYLKSTTFLPTTPSKSMSTTSQSSDDSIPIITTPSYPTTDALHHYRKQQKKLLTAIDSQLPDETTQQPQSTTPIHPGRPLRLAFFGASDITPPILDFLMEASKVDSPINHGRPYPLIESIDIITSPPVTRITKKAKYTQLSPLAQQAEKYGLQIESYSPNKLTPFRTHFELSRPEGFYDIALVFSFPRLIPPRLINKFPMGMINIHPSLIPLYRGPAPMQSTLQHNDRTAGVSIITIEPHKFDIGYVIAQQEFPLGKDVLLQDLTSVVQDISKDLLGEILDPTNWATLYKNKVNQDIIMADYTKKYSPEYLSTRLHAPKYGSVVAPNFEQQTADEFFGLFRGVSGFRQVHAKIAAKPHTDRDGNIKPKDPLDIILADIQLDHDGALSDFQPLENVPGSAVFDPKLDSIRVRCRDNTTLLFKQFVTTSGSKTEAKALANGFFVKNQGKFRGNFLSVLVDGAQFHGNLVQEIKPMAQDEPIAPIENGTVQ
jgi:methionyl-tRNA formyltransferase